LHALNEHPEDVPFAVIYASDDDYSSASSSSWTTVSRKYQLQGTMGIDAQNAAIPKSFDLTESESVYGLGRACRDAMTQRETVILRRHDDTLPSDLATPIPGRGWGDAIEAVCVMPVSMTAYGAMGFLIVGLNPRRPFNQDSLQFAHSLRDVLAKSSAQLSQARFEEIHDNLSNQLKVSTLRAARNEEKFTRLAESAPIGICTFRPDGKPLYCNDQYLALVGIPREFDWNDLWDTDAAWRDQIHPDDVEGIDTAWQSLLKKTKKFATVEYRIKRPWSSYDKATGSELTGETWLMNHAVSELDENGNVLYIHAWLHDTSFRHYTESLLSNRLQEALETKRASENFM
jgi:PAS domain-containing protein